MRPVLGEFYSHTRIRVSQIHGSYLNRKNSCFGVHPIGLKITTGVSNDSCHIIGYGAVTSKAGRISCMSIVKLEWVFFITSYFIIVGMVT